MVESILISHLFLMGDFNFFFFTGMNFLFHLFYFLFVSLLCYEEIRWWLCDPSSILLFPKEFIISGR